MSLFSNSKKGERIGAVIDIGSGSAMVAIVISKPDEKNPLVIWSHREQAPLRHIESMEESAKSVITSLVNALLKFDGEGRRALYEYNKQSKVDEIQCAISAPWAYTITKTISYQQEEPFEVTKSLLESLAASALKDTEAELHENKIANELGLAAITKSALAVYANGYRVTNPHNSKAKDVSLSQVNVFTQKQFVEHLEMLRHKMFADKPMHTLSYMLAFFAVAEETFHSMGDFCLVDITYEATELGIVRDGTLSYATHTPFGSFSLAREISNITSVPLYQAFQYLHNEQPLLFMEALSDTKRQEVQNVLDAYKKRLVDLFQETGDALSIPKKMYIHTDSTCETLFTDIIKAAGAEILKSSPVLQPVSSYMQQYVDILDATTSTDTAMLVSAHFFHTQNVRRNYEYL